MIGAGQKASLLSSFLLLFHLLCTCSMCNSLSQCALHFITRYQIKKVGNSYVFCTINSCQLINLTDYVLFLTFKAANGAQWELIACVWFPVIIMLCNLKILEHLSCSSSCYSRAFSCQCWCQGGPVVARWTSKFTLFVWMLLLQVLNSLWDFHRMKIHWSGILDEKKSGSGWALSLELYLDSVLWVLSLDSICYCCVWCCPRL